jgi:hypothetical protein
MTRKQLQKLQAKKRNEKKRAKAKASRVREALRVEKRKAKRSAKSAPRRNLKNWSAEVQARDDRRCIVCGCREMPKLNKDGSPKLNKRQQAIRIRLHVHHILPKERYPEFKLLIINGITLCPKHHKYDKFSAHRNPLWFTKWLEQNRPLQFAWAVDHMGGGDI